MDMIAWLEDLVAAYRIQPSEATIRRYLKSLEQWKLSREDWDRLSDLAVLRFTRFPSIAELYEIAIELLEEAQMRANSEWLADLHRKWERSEQERHE